MLATEHSTIFSTKQLIQPKNLQDSQQVDPITVNKQNTTISYQTTDLAVIEPHSTHLISTSHTSTTLPLSDDADIIKPNKQEEKQILTIQWQKANPQPAHFFLAPNNSQSEAQAKLHLAEAIKLKISSLQNADLLQQSIDKFLQAAQSPHTAVSAIYQLGGICEEQQQWHLAIKWYTLAFHYRWSQDPTNHYESAIYKKIQALVTSNDIIWLPLKQIFYLYPKSIKTSAEKIAHYMALIHCYKEQDLEPYLSKKERELKIKSLEPALNLFDPNYLDIYQTIATHYNQAIFDLEAENYPDAQQNLLAISYYPIALYQLGIMHETGNIKGGKPHPLKAQAYFEQSGIPDAWYNLGLMHWKEQINGKSNPLKAKACFEQSGTPEAWYALGNMFCNGEIDGTANFLKATAYFELASTPDALCKLGLIHWSGEINGKPNPLKAKACFEQSGTPDALCNLGIMYIQGEIDGKPNPSKAKACFERSKTPNALYNLGLMHWSGKINGKPNPSKAKTCFEQSGSPDALCNLGIMYIQGQIGGKPNPSKAKACFEQSGTPDALYNLGIMYIQGQIDGQPNPLKAKACFEQSDTPDALYNLGLMYLKGQIDGQPNYLKAKKYYELANTPDALYDLGFMYWEGKIDGKPDPLQAQAYFERSNTSDALLNLGVMHLDGEFDGKPNYTKAKEYYELANTPDALYNLGLMYLKGQIDGQPNYLKAQACFEQSGIPHALFALGTMHFRGEIEGKPNYLKAQVYFESSKQPLALYNIGVMCLQDNSKKTISTDGVEPIDYQTAYQYFYQSNLLRSMSAIIDLYVENKIQPPNQQSKQQAVEEIVQKAYTLFHSSTPNAENCMYKGIINYTIRNWEEALIDFQQALFYGCTDSDKSFILRKIEKIYDYLEKKHPQTNLTAKEESTQKPKISNKATKAEKQLRRFKRIQAQFLDSLSLPFKTLKKDSPNPIEFVFLNEKAKNKFEAFKKENKKVNELLDDIKYYKWQANGIGKPEVLLGLYKGYKGCISRRINNEIRIIYKAFDEKIGEGKILILDWESHY